MARVITPAVRQLHREPPPSWRLVLIKGGVAYFVSPDSYDSCWGDDWDDTPHDCNAGDPWPQHAALPFTVEAHVCGGSDSAFSKTRWGWLSVDQIRGGAAPWLCTWEQCPAEDTEVGVHPRHAYAGGERTYPHEVGYRVGDSLPAGASFADFLAFVYAHDGHVYREVDR